jgi:hypothetical protein
MPAFTGARRRSGSWPNDVEQIAERRYRLVLTADWISTKDARASSQFLDFKGSRDPRELLYLLRDLRAAKGNSIQDQQNQTLNQHDSGHPRDGKH